MQVCVFACWAPPCNTDIQWCQTHINDPDSASVHWTRNVCIFYNPGKIRCTCIIRGSDCHQVSLSEHLLTKAILNSPSFSVPSYDRAGWAPAVTLSLRRQKTNFSLTPSRASCNLMRRKMAWELFASFSNYTFLKFTVMAAFLSLISASLLLPLHLLFYQLPACDMTNGCCSGSLGCRKVQKHTKKDGQLFPQLTFFNYIW